MVACIKASDCACVALIASSICCLLFCITLFAASEITDICSEDAFVSSISCLWFSSLSWAAVLDSNCISLSAVCASVSICEWLASVKTFVDAARASISCLAASTIPLIWSLQWSDSISTACCAASASFFTLSAKSATRLSLSTNLSK